MLFLTFDFCDMAYFDYLESDFIDVSEIQPLDVEELSDDEEEVIEPRRRGKGIDWRWS